MRILFISNNKLLEDSRRNQLSILAEPWSIKFLYSINEADNYINNQIVKFQEPLDLIIADEYFGKYKTNLFFDTIRFNIKDTYSRRDFNLRGIPTSLILATRQSSNSYYEDDWVQNYYEHRTDEILPVNNYANSIKNWRRQVLKELRDLNILSNSGNIDYSYYFISTQRLRTDTKILSANFKFFTRKLNYDWLINDTEKIKILIDEFVRKLKRSEMTKRGEEKMYHKFFNENESLLKRDAFKKYYYEPKLYYTETNYYEPDYVLKPEMTFKTDLSILEVKLPNELIAKKKKHHPTLRSKFMDHLFQINDYKEYLEEMEYKNQINNTFGYVPNNIEYNILIGRKDHKEENEYLIQQRMKQMNSKIKIITYDDLLDYQVKYLERLDLLKIKH